MKVVIKEMNDGSAVIETLYGQQISYFKNVTEAQLAYVEWYRGYGDERDDENYYLM
ncbi:MAG: hypothetical protein ACC653_03510 [Gammaproteobacteria bacterium]